MLETNIVLQKQLLCSLCSAIYIYCTSLKSSCIQPATQQFLADLLQGWNFGVCVFLFLPPFNGESSSSKQICCILHLCSRKSWIQCYQASFLFKLQFFVAQDWNSDEVRNNYFFLTLTLVCFSWPAEKMLEQTRCSDSSRIIKTSCTVSYQLLAVFFG